MKSENMLIIRYDADEGKVFDWAELSNHMSQDEEGNYITNHLYAKTLFIGQYDSIDNYIEVDEPHEENEGQE